MRKNIFPLMLAMLTFNGFAQTLVVSNAETNEPIEMVSLASESPKGSVYTNENGMVDITQFKGAEKIMFTLLDYQSEYRSYDELEKDGFKLDMVPSLNLNPVIVYGTKWSQKSQDLPISSISISAKDIALQNPQTAADMLAGSGYVYVQKSQQGGGSPMIRGFSTNRLLYSVDGVRMNTAIFRGGNIQNVISLDPFAIEHSEVIFGPGSVVYGSDAIGGVMGFQTLTAKLSLDDKVLVSGKSVLRYSTANNEKTAHFDVNIGGKKWASVTSFTSNDFGDLTMGSHGPNEYLRNVYVTRQDSTDIVVDNSTPKVQTPSGYTQMNLMQKIRFKPNEKWDLQYAFHYSETSAYSRYDRHLRTKNDLPRYGEWYYGPQKWMMNNLVINHKSEGKVFDEMTIRMAVQNFEESRISRNFNKADRETRTEYVDAYSLNIDFKKDLNEMNHFFYGIEGVMNDVNSLGVDENITTGVKQKGASRYPNATWSTYAAYATFQHKFSDELIFDIGARYSQFIIDATFDTTFYKFSFTEAKLNEGGVTGSAGLVFKPGKSWIIRTNLSTGYRAPNIDDLGKVFDSEPGSVVVPNPDLQAENAYNVDLAIAKVFGKYVKVDMTGYYTQLNNALVRRDYTFNGADSILYDGELSQVQAMQNAAKTTVFGIQAGIEVKLMSGFGLVSQYNYQVGMEELDNGDISPSRHAAPAFGTTRLTYQKKKLSLQYYAVYNAEVSFDKLPESEKGKNEIYAMDENGDPYSPSWYTLNFKALYQFHTNFTVTAGVENLLDARYRPYSSGLTAAGRNLILALKIDF
jgi:hemoglobin/transferrin/lactoferrin receptor protein